MCGIAGLFHFRDRRPVDRDVLDRMRYLLRHRGPDGEGTFVEEFPSVGLVHRRLSIIDIDGGKQPMSNASEELWIVFNGEIYNFPTLRRELESGGYRFRTKSDTEVVVALYETYGTKGISRLNGIFAFALYDRRRRRVVLARDHFGVKPLYYHADAERIVFGSEIKAILTVPGVEPQVDPDALREFLVLRYNPSPRTMFLNIKKLEPGTLLVVDHDGAMHQEAFWSELPSSAPSLDEDEVTEEYQRLLKESVERQMLSDVPVGLMLSGGIDSAVIGHLMRSRASYRIKSFTVGFEGKGDYNELADARATAALLGTEHYELTVSKENYKTAFFDSFAFTEEPIAEPTIPALFHVARLASQHVKVVLAGQGADEPLGGYRKYLGEAYLMRLGASAMLLPFGLMSMLLRRDEGLARLARAAGATEPYARFLALNTIFSPEQLSRVLRVGGSNNNDVSPRLRTLFERSATAPDSLSRILYVDTRSYLSDDLLIFGDKMTMANALEMRVPFLDPALVTFLESLPGSFKIRGTRRKYIHKRAARAWLPPEIINRKKRGFLTPMDEWLQKDLGELCAQLVREKDSFSQEHLDPQCVLQLIEDHTRKRANYYKHVFAVLCLELWYRNFVRKRAVIGDFQG
jgi:asparagine synthase (glutamine-hydrolysing)